MMEYDEMFTVLSMCFAPVERDEWKHVADGPVWSDFLDAVRRALQDDGAFGASTSPMARARTRCPLQEFLSAGEVKALYAPPSYDEKRQFAARHFTGGLPESAVPVESLYTAWSNGSLPSPFSKTESMYQGESARYMRDLIERMGMQVPPEFAACADHLALELDLTAVLLRSGCAEEAVRFVTERFAWLTAYRMRLLELTDDAGFYIGLVDVLVGVRARLAAPSEDEGGGEDGVGAEGWFESEPEASNADTRVERNRLHACI